MVSNTKDTEANNLYIVGTITIIDNPIDKAFKKLKTIIHFTVIRILVIVDNVGILAFL